MGRETQWPVMTVHMFVCRDIGMDCPFWAEAPTEHELMGKIASHIKNIHHIDPLPGELAEKINNAIRKKSSHHQPLYVSQKWGQCSPVR